MSHTDNKATATQTLEKAEWHLYFFTALQNAGYIIFLLLYHDYVHICDPSANGVWLATTVLFSAVLVGNLYSIYAGFESDARGHGRGIRKSFDCGVLHGLILAALPWILVPGMPPAASSLILFLAVLMQAVSSAYVNASYHAWFVAAARNLGYEGALDPYTSRRRLITNLVWLGLGIVILWPFQYLDIKVRVTLSGLFIAFFYLLGSLRIRKIMTSSEDIGSFESDRSYESSSISLNCWDSFKHARQIIRQDKTSISAVTLWVITWSLGVMVLYFWQEAFAEHPANEKLAGLTGLIWLCMTVGRVVGNGLAVLPGKATSEIKRRRLRLGGWLNGLPMVLFAVWLIINHFYPTAYSKNSETILAAVIAVLLIVINRVGQEIVLPFAYARIHESKAVGISQNRAAVESLLAVWTTIPLALAWAMISYLESIPEWKPLVVSCVYGFLGILVIAFAFLNKKVAGAVSKTTGKEESSTGSPPSASAS